MDVLISAVSRLAVDAESWRPTYDEQKSVPLSQDTGFRLIRFIQHLSGADLYDVTSGRASICCESGLWLEKGVDGFAVRAEYTSFTPEKPEDRKGLPDSVPECSGNVTSAVFHLSFVGFSSLNRILAADSRCRCSRFFLCRHWNLLGFKKKKSPSICQMIFPHKCGAESRLWCSGVW